MNRATSILGDISPTLLGVHRAADIVAALTPPATPKAAIVPVPAAPPAESLMSKAKKFAPGVAGAGVGAYAWKKHRVLGALAGHAIVNNGYEFYKGNRRKAICDTVVEGSGIAASLFSKKMPVKFLKHPVAAYVAGVVAGAAATYFVPGSPIKDQIARIRSKF